jgi:hypothetical protein
MAMIISLQRRLEGHSDGDRERQFFSHLLRYLTLSTGLQVELKNWMITSYEVEFGRKLGSGALYVPSSSYTPMTNPDDITIAGRYSWVLGTILK